MTLKLNGRKLILDQQLSLLQLCSSRSIDIPRFCYHEQLSIAGNCRMCLVEIDSAVKPVVSCSMPATEGLSVRTNTLLVRKARENVMEFLLVNHPLDCPICDQGGECDLQDQALIFGNDRGRFYEAKRAVSSKFFGPLIKAIMTRCIHCTRCVRFLGSLTAANSFGVTGRGNIMEIGSYISKNIFSEVSGNVIDLCPVGALTAQTSSFKVRSWELIKLASVDVMDSFGANISMCFRGSSVFKILPEVVGLLDEPWITDKIRFSYDSFFTQRLAVPLYREPCTSMLMPLSWDESFSIFLRKAFLHNSTLTGVVGSLISLESLFLFKSFLLRFGQSSLLSQEFSSEVSLDFIDGNYQILANSFKKLSQISSTMFIGLNLRFESPLVLVKIRLLAQKKKFFILTLGCPVFYGLDLPITNIGNSSRMLLSIFEGTHSVSVSLLSFYKFIVFYSISGLSLSFKKVVQKGFDLISSLKKKLFRKKTFLYLIGIFTGANIFNFLDIGSLGFNRYGNESSNLLFSLGSDEIILKNSSAFRVYQGHHGDLFAILSNLVFPSSAFFEQDSTFSNYLALNQKTSKVLVESLLGGLDWHLLNSLSFYFFDVNVERFVSFKDLSERIKKILNYTLPWKLSFFKFPEIYLKQISFMFLIFTFNSYISDYFLTNTLVRSSKTMAKASLSSKKLLVNFKKLF